MNRSTAEPLASCSDSQFMTETVEGLTATRKTLNPKYFYDENGSSYFDEICQLQEYYPYRTELSLLAEVAQDLAASLEASVSVVEFGAGSLHKIRPLLDKVSQIEEFVPVDISDDHLQHAAASLQQQYSQVAVSPITADFCQPMNLPRSGLQRMGFFPGSTIGNFAPGQACDFLRSARSTLGANSQLLIGVDTKKSPALLHDAYNDSRGITAKFNLNILHRINRELGSNICVDNFQHYAFYDTTRGRIEMHLVSLVAQRFQLGEYVVEFEQGESIHTESSYKYNPQDFAVLAENSGWSIENSWFADDDMFSMYLLRS